jgi:hypothetical protein
MLTRRSCSAPPVTLDDAERQLVLTELERDLLGLLPPVPADLTDVIHQHAEDLPS